MLQRSFHHFVCAYSRNINLTKTQNKHSSLFTLKDTWRKHFNICLSEIQRVENYFLLLLLLLKSTLSFINMKTTEVKQSEWTASSLQDMNNQMSLSNMLRRKSTEQILFSLSNNSTSDLLCKWAFKREENLPEPLQKLFIYYFIKTNYQTLLTIGNLILLFVTFHCELSFGMLFKTKWTTWINVLLVLMGLFTFFWHFLIISDENKW